MKRINEIKKETMRISVGRKSMGAIAVAVVIMVAALILEGIFINNFIADTEIMKRTARELGVISAVNAVEFAKKALQQAVSYSFYKSSFDVLDTGGFCVYDEDPCVEDCKIPNDVPSLNCRPWWRAYSNRYAPELYEFVYFLADRTSAMYDDYAELFFGPNYCPRPPGRVTVEDMGNYIVHVGITNTEDGIIEYTATDLDIVEHTVNFTDTFGASTLDLFEFAREKFVASDKIRSDFGIAEDLMPNTWCEMADGYCDLTADCSKACWDGNCCCKDMYFGYICEYYLPECEAALDDYCSREEIACDFNDDGTVDAEEKYRCTAEEAIETPVTNWDGTLEAVASVADCIKVNHDSTREDSGSFSVHWENPDPGKCQWINEDSAGNDCGCADECTGCEANCGECCGITSTDGWDSGQCPTGAPWNGGKTVTCPDGCCAIEWTCEERSEKRCDGSNTHSCTPTDCPSKCCEGGIPPDCKCSECDLKDECKVVECPMFGPCNPKCCEWIWDGPRRICVRKDFECEPCCKESCERKSCDDVNPTSYTVTECVGECYPECECMGGSEECPDCVEITTTYYDCPCGCDYEEDWEHKIELKCRANVCGYECCEETSTVYADVKCSYDYYGTANTTVRVRDIGREYPIGSLWTTLVARFNVVSGNVAGCMSNEPIESSDYVEDPSVICCPAITTNEADKAAACKVIETTTTTTTIPNCPSYRCSEAIDKCKCGTVICEAPDNKYCCEGLNSCYDTDIDCETNCPTTTTTTTTPP